MRFPALFRVHRVMYVLAVSVAVGSCVSISVAQAASVTIGSPQGVVPHHKGTTSVGLSAQFPQPSLQYWGGPVLRSNETFAIFWDPAGAFSASYRDLVNQFLHDVAADSGKTTNAYSVLNQYFDTTSPITYDSSFAGSATDTDPYPSGCPATTQYPVCFTDQQLGAELDAFLYAQGITRSANRVFLVFTPAGVNTCFTASGFACASNLFCAYHAGFTGGHGDAIYADLPYAAVPGCDTGQHPNGSDADPVLDLASHEHKEMIDDPLIWQAISFSGRGSLAPPLAWYDRYRGESDDKCQDYYGPTQTNGVGAYNQVINGHAYLLQAEWSNALAQAQGLGCVTDGTDRAPSAAFNANPHGAVTAFDASASSDPDPGDSIKSYFWNFGDGTSAFTDATTDHRFPAAGTYRVVLYVTDSHGAASRVQQDVTVSAPGPTKAFQAKLTEYFDDARRVMYGGGNATDLGTVREYGAATFDFSNFPATFGVSSGYLQLWHVDSTGAKSAFLVQYHATLTDSASPPAGNNYTLTGNYSIVSGYGEVQGAYGAGTITGTCTSSFTSDIAQCTDTWNGTLGGVP